MVSHLHLASDQPQQSTSRGHAEQEAPAPIRVVLADDHQLMRQTLRELLDADPAFEVIAVEHDFSAAARAVAQQRPHVLVLDLSMSDSHGPDTVRMLRKRHPDTQITVLTTDDSAVPVQRVLDAGALGYVLKELADAELPDAVRAASHGHIYISPRVGVRLDELYSAMAHGRITPREVEVLRLIALGHTSVEIARKLNLSPRTIETHRAHIHQKLGLATRAELVRYALQRGLLRG